MPRPRIVACLAAAGPEDPPSEGASRVARADLVEVRLDAIAGEPSVAAALCEAVAQWQRPLMLTPRSAGEGGVRRWGEGQRRAFLEAAWGADSPALVDVELRDSPDLLDWVLANRPEGCQVLASYHAFDRYPGSGWLDVLALEAEARGADHFKVAVPVADPGEMADLACWTHRRSRFQSLITMGLGAEGCLSRVMNPAFGSWACYASLDRATGPGQLGLEELADLVDRFYPEEAGSEDASEGG